MRRGLISDASCNAAAFDHPVAALPRSDELGVDILLHHFPDPRFDGHPSR